MKKYILLLSLVLGSILSYGQWVPVGNTLQRSVDGTGFKYRFSLGSPGFYSISDSIRAAGKTYTAGYGMSLVGQQFRVDTSVIVSKDFFTKSKADTSNLDNYMRIAAWGDSFIGGVADITIEKFPVSLTNSTKIYVSNNGFPGQTSTYIKNQFLADTTQRNSAVFIWSGKNNYTEISNIVSDIRTMVNLLPHQNYLVASVFNSDTPDQYAGEPGYIDIMNLNAALQAEFGDHYIDIRSYIVSRYDPSIPADVTAHSRDVPPPSRMSDITHLNTLGNRESADFVMSQKRFLFRDNGQIVTSKSIPYILFKSGLTLKSDTKELISQNVIVGQGIRSNKSIGESPSNSDVGVLLSLENQSNVKEGVDNPDTRIFTAGQRGNDAFIRLFKDNLNIRNATDNTNLFSFSSNGAFTSFGGAEINGHIVGLSSIGTSPSNMDAGALFTLVNKSLPSDTRVLSMGQLGSESFLRQFQNFSFKNAATGENLFRLTTNGNWFLRSSGVVGGLIDISPDSVGGINFFKTVEGTSGIRRVPGALRISTTLIDSLVIGKLDNDGIFSENFRVRNNGNIVAAGTATASDATLSTELATLGQIQSNFVTTNTVQTITAVTKTFTGSVNFQNISATGIEANVLSLAQKSVAADVNYSVVESDYTILVQGGTVNATVTLPNSAIGKMYVIKRVNGGTNTITISAASIDGVATKTLIVDYSGVVLQSAGSGQYYIIGSF